MSYLRATNAAQRAVCRIYGQRDTDVLRQRSKRREERDGLEAGDLGIAAFDAATESDGKSISQKIGIEQASLGFLSQIQVKAEVGCSIGRTARVTRGGDVLPPAGKEGTEVDLAGF